MITRTQAERIAQSINAIRKDWPIPSLISFITDNLTGWSLLDAYVGLAYVAIERTPDGSQWASKTPARIKENGPWQRINSLDSHSEAAHARAAAEVHARKQAIKARNAAITACTSCDHLGRLPEGGLCRHDKPPTERALQAKARADQARQQIRKAATNG